MRQWYYIQEDQQRGPISEPDLVKLFESEQLAPETMVWTEELEEWVVARDIEGLISPAHKPPSLATTQPIVSAMLAPEYMPSGEQIRPWVRYWARAVDFLLFCFLAGIVLTFVYEPALEMPDAVFSIMLLFAYVFIEPAMLSGWGTTPGKALFKVRLRNNDGSKLSYGNALSRAFKVWFRGEGIGIPIVTLFTHICAYNRLTKQNITSWDEDGNFTVNHQVIEAWRIIVAVLIFIAFAFLIAFGEADI